MSQALQLLVDGLVQGSRIALVAVGFSLIYGVTRTLHLAHGAIITTAAYVVWWMTAKLSAGLAAAFLVAAVVVVLLGVGHDLLLYRRIRAATTGGFTIVVASLGTGIIIQNLVGVLFGFDTKDVRAATVGQASAGLRLGPVVMPITDLITVAVTVVLFALLGLLLLQTRIGKQLRAVQDNPQLARVVGIRTPRVYAITFAIGSLVSMPAAFFVGLSGGLNTTIGFDAMLLALVVAFAGGIGSLLGTLLASFGVGILQTMSLLVVDSRWEATVTFTLLLLLVTVRPRGLLGEGQLMEYLLSLLVFAAIYAIAAMSFNLLIGHAGIFSVAHAAFIGIGAYATGILTTRAIGLFPVAWVLGAVVAGAVGWVFARATLRVSGDYMVVASFALVVIFSQVFTNWTTVTGGGAGLSAIPRPGFVDGELLGSNWLFCLLCLAMAGLMYFVSHRLVYSPLGRVLRALRENEDAAASLGKFVRRYRAIVFTVSSAMAAVSGSLYAHFMSYISPLDFTVHLTVLILTMVIVAGTSRLWTVPVAAALVMVITDGVRYVDLPERIAPGAQQILYGLLLVVFAVLRPEGLMGRKKEKSSDGPHQ